MSSYLIVLCPFYEPSLIVNYSSKVLSYAIFCQVDSIVEIYYCRANREIELMRAKCAENLLENGEGIHPPKEEEE